MVWYELPKGRRRLRRHVRHVYKISNEAPRRQPAARGAAKNKGTTCCCAPGKQPPTLRTGRTLAGPGGAHQGLPRQRSQDTEAERFARLRALPFFADFHDVALWELMRLGNWRRLEQGTVLMRENTPGDSFCILIEGQVAVSRQGWNLSTLGPGVTLGEMTYLRPTQDAHRHRRAETRVGSRCEPSLREASEDRQRARQGLLKLLVGRLMPQRTTGGVELVAAPYGRRATKEAARPASPRNRWLSCARLPEQRRGCAPQRNTPARNEHQPVSKSTWLRLQRIPQRSF